MGPFLGALALGSLGIIAVTPRGQDAAKSTAAAAGKTDSQAAGKSGGGGGGASGQLSAVWQPCMLETLMIAIIDNCKA